MSKMVSSYDIYDIPREVGHKKKKKAELTAEDLAEIRFELQKRNYTLEEKIGEGGYAHIFKLTNSVYNQSFALKAIYHGFEEFENKMNASFQAECEALMNLDYPNIIKIYDTFSSKKFHYIILEYCPLGSLKDYSSPLSIQQFRDISLTILKTIKYCHDKGFAHCDIKPSNFLIDIHGKIKLADFGLSLHFYDDTNNEIKKSTRFGGSKPFMAPELLRHQAYDPRKADIWSVAVTLFFLYTKRFPWSSTELSIMKQEIIEGAIKFPPNINPKVGWFLTSMFIVQPEHRPLADIIIQNDFYKDIQIQKMQARGLTLIEKNFLNKSQKQSPATQSQKPYLLCNKLPLISEDRASSHRQKKMSLVGRTFPMYSFKTHA